MLQVGYIPGLDLAFSMAFNSYVAMNSSLPITTAGDDVRHQRQFCRAIAPVLRSAPDGGCRRDWGDSVGICSRPSCLDFYSE